MTSRKLILAGLVVLGLALLPFLRSRPPALEWHHSPESAFSVARASGLNVLVFLYTDWCGYCRRMDRTTFVDPAVIGEMGEAYVWLRLNAEKDPAGVKMQQDFGVSGYPTILILDPEGREIDRIPGFLPPERFPEAVRSRVESPRSLAGIRRRLEVDPSDVSSHFELATRLMERGMAAEATDHFRKVTELDAENRSGRADAGWYFLAEAQAGSGRMEAALEALAQLRQRFPDSHFAQEAYLMEAEIRMRQGDDQGARNLLARFLREHPDHRAAAQVRDLLAEQR
ncbi:MAG: hypothetical protein Kow001_03900 [Acidobacteriota bacterium]